MCMCLCPQRERQNSLLVEQIGNDSVPGEGGCQRARERERESEKEAKIETLSRCTEMYNLFFIIWC